MSLRLEIKNNMKKIVTLFILVIAMSSFVNVMNAQDVQTIKLEQTEGEFNIKGLTLSEGTYQFEVMNNGVDHEVGFVIAPKGKSEMKDHIKTGYLSETIKSGKKASSGEVKLKAGEYVYFCPMNPTPEYIITVK